MADEFEVRWDGVLSATPQQVWDAFTMHTAGWLWRIEYEPWVGGAERGLTSLGGSVTAWDPPQRFITRAEDGAGFNELDYRLEPRGSGTYLRYAHRGVFAEDYGLNLDACRQHTAFYYHSLREYVHYFSGREATYVSVEAPDTSTRSGFAMLRRALGLSEELAPGDPVRLKVPGVEPIEGVVDYTTTAFLGVRSTDALYRFFGRDRWAWPVAVALHLFDDGADGAGTERAWTAWLDDLFATTDLSQTEAVA